MERPTEKCQAGDRIPTVGTEVGKKQTTRLYPSLPHTERVEGVKLDNSITKKFHDNCQRESLLGIMTTEISAADTDSTMKAQIAILKRQKRELFSINEKWAKEYQTMVQHYKEKVQWLKALLQLDNIQMEEEVCEAEKQRALEKHLKNSMTVKDSKEGEQRGSGDVSPALLRAEQEAERLRAQNSTLTRRGQHQHEEIMRLNKALQEALQTPPARAEHSKTPEDVWKHQAEIYKEDFLKEREDREKLKGKHLELERRFRKIHAELHTLKSQIPRTPPSPKPVTHCTCTCRANQAPREGSTHQRAPLNT
ncbi:TNFAIP3-interacting protein 1-like [Myripristis murdjan]|uniref:TNFAIP3-interacting protein 1-like n=1 Tax=Myripristis murdjan TaxID=586833 RepID=UPI001175DAE6|nr:TNFAIP3-interacting protein 1-like [Myripristis murdjan]